MKRIVLSAILFLIVFITVPVLAVFPLFLFIYSIQSRIQLDTNHFYIKYTILGIIFGLFTEILAILDNLDKPPHERILFHPNPGTDLLLGVGFYFFIAVMWAFLTRRYTFTVKSIFVIGGIWGIVVEQNAAILSSPLTQGIVIGMFSYVFVFLVYGPFMAIPILFFKDLHVMNRKARKNRHAVLAFIMLCTAYVLAGGYMILLYVGLGLS
ncbi:MAG: hypothetical protein HXS44_09725 [Theionarchaea archaeon]|nr:hypothetical protein [Theionarchaea archaeon]